jgi:hypothetical protein
MRGGMRLAGFVVERVPGHESDCESNYNRLIDLHATVHQSGLLTMEKGFSQNAITGTQVVLYF